MNPRHTVAPLPKPARAAADGRCQGLLPRVSPPGLFPPPVARKAYRGTADGLSRFPSLRSAASPILTDRRRPRCETTVPTGGAAASGKSRGGSTTIGAGRCGRRSRSSVDDVEAAGRPSPPPAVDLQECPLHGARRDHRVTVTRLSHRAARPPATPARRWRPATPRVVLPRGPQPFPARSSPRASAPARRRPRGRSATRRHHPSSVSTP